jgi:hypothetical protein
VVKLHLLEHMPLLIKLFGAPKYWDTVLSEARHKSVKTDVRSSTGREGTFQGEILKKQTSDQVNDSGRNGGSLVGTNTSKLEEVRSVPSSLNITEKDVGGHGQTLTNWRRISLQWDTIKKQWGAHVSDCNPIPKNSFTISRRANHRKGAEPEGSGGVIPYLFPGNNKRI